MLFSLVTFGIHTLKACSLVISYYVSMLYIQYCTECSFSLASSTRDGIAGLTGHTPAAVALIRQDRSVLGEEEEDRDRQQVLSDSQDKDFVSR